MRRVEGARLNLPPMCDDNEWEHQWVELEAEKILEFRACPKSEIIDMTFDEYLVERL